MASPSDPPTDRAGDTAQFPVTRVSTAAATDTDDVPSTGGPAHAVTAGTPGISRAGWWAITIAAAVLLVLGFLLTFGPARYWTPVPVVFLGYFLLSGVIGLVFWKGVRELRDSNPTLHSGDGPATPGARVAAAIGAVGVASALVLLPAGLSDAPANAAPCPDGSNTCGPQPTMGPQPTQGNGGNTTAPQAPNTTVPGYTPPDTPPQQGNGSTPTVQGQVPTMPTGESPSNGCIFNCGPTQAPQAPQTGQATPPQTAQNPVTTAPNTPATTPQAPTTTPRLRTPTPETTTSTTSSKARDRDDDQQRSSDEDREKNSGIPYQAAEIAALAGTYRRKKTSDAVRVGQVVSESATEALLSKPVRGAPDEPVVTFLRGLRTDRKTIEAFEPPELNPDKIATQNKGRSTYNTEHDPNTLARLQEVKDRLKAARKAGSIAGLELSEMLLQHFLDGSGATFNIPNNTYLDSMPQMKSIRDKAIKEAVQEAIAAGRTDGVAIPFASDWEVVNPGKADPDVFLAHGVFSGAVSGFINVQPDGSYTANYVYHLYDYYDWEAVAARKDYTRAIWTTQEEIGRLHDFGLAQSFPVTSTSRPFFMTGKA
ncbi:phage holin family protein [Tsukamurella tyrosinosolvens]|uniref:phage holin family protein n=1 Tax=Tsukamurella tyrosinosolvens TaxID=57704 RepID=UPI002DD42B6C|nr:hypothetical protein [Tsukamurella tyrosinosolvens]MEC4614495.1 hypothetical protein [Tsukamurella tyrosinosolvens]